MYISRHVNCHNVCIWGSENFRALMEHLCNSPKANIMVFSVSRLCYFGLFSFADKSVDRCPTLTSWKAMPFYKLEIKICFLTIWGAPHYINVVWVSKWAISSNLNRTRWVEGLAIIMLTWPCHSLFLFLVLF